VVLVITITLTGIDELQQKARPETITDSFRQFFNNATKAVERNVKEMTPVDNGHLRASITGRVDTSNPPLYSFVGTYGPAANYAPFVEWDTKPHDIRPKNGRFLSFQLGGKLMRGTARKVRGVAIGGGEWVFTRLVHHPGTKGQHMFERGADYSRNDIDDELSVMANDIEARWAR
jgi:hypothetical protein